MIVTGKPTIPEVIPALKEYYHTEGNAAGGSLHAVLEDGNLRDCDVKYCIEYAKERGDLAGVSLGETLLKMSRTQRNKLANMFYNL